jgi:hypothetical protein
MPIHQSTSFVNDGKNIKDMGYYFLISKEQQSSLPENGLKRPEFNFQVHQQMRARNQR